MTTVITNAEGSNKENLEAFWFEVEGFTGGGPRWGENGADWGDAIAGIPDGTFDAYIQVSNLGGTVIFQITIPAQERTKIYNGGENSMYVSVADNGDDTSTILLEVGVESI